MLLHARGARFHGVPPYALPHDADRFDAEPPPWQPPWVRPPGDHPRRCSAGGPRGPTEWEPEERAFSSLSPRELKIDVERSLHWNRRLRQSETRQIFPFVSKQTPAVYTRLKLNRWGRITSGMLSKVIPPPSFKVSCSFVRVPPRAGPMPVEGTWVRSRAAGEPVTSTASIDPKKSA